MRSLLMAPADDEWALRASLTSEAHAVLVGLDRPAPSAARETFSRAFGTARGVDRPSLIVRVSDFQSGETDADLEAVMACAPFGILVRAGAGAVNVQRLAAKLAVKEAECGLADETTRILALVDTAEAVLALSALRNASARLVGLVWDEASLAEEIGGATDASPIKLARDLTLLAAAAARVAAIEGAFLNGGDLEALRAATLAGRRDGFSAKLAVSEVQAKVINAAYALSPMERR